MKQKTWLLVALISSAVSFGIHFYLSLHNYQLRFGLSEGESLCNVSSRFNCDAVSVSDYSQLFGIPIALFGVLTHAAFCLLLIIAMIGIAQNPPRILRVSFILSAFVALMSVLMAIVSATLLHTYCLFCAATYVLSALLFFAMWMACKPMTWTDLKEDINDLIKEHRWLLGVFVAIPAFTFLANSMLLDSYGQGEIKLRAANSLYHWQENPANNFDNNRGITKGPMIAPFVLVEFADYLCPHCKHAAPTLAAFTESRQNLRFVFKAFPLDGTCNNAIKQKGDGLRCQLSYASLCAEKVSRRGWDVHHYIFKHQAEWNLPNFDKDFEKMCLDQNLNCAEIKACMQANETHEDILKQAAEGEAAKIEGTPSIFVNGKKLDNGQFLPVLNTVIK